MNDRIDKPTPASKATPATLIPTSSESSSKAAKRTVHVVTNSKGGIGKSLVSWNLVQYLRDKGRALVAVDLDPLNHSLAEFRGLGARSVDLLTGLDMMAFNGAAMDQLAEDMLLNADGADYVLDNGSSGFVTLTQYLCDNEFGPMLHEREGRLVIHAVLGGSSMSAQCLIGLHTLLEAFGANGNTKFVLWVNEYFGPFGVQGTGLKEMAVYREMTQNQQLLGTVLLPRQKAAFLTDFNRMCDSKLTYNEAIASPEFLLMNKQRLTVIRRGIWTQLDALKLVA